MEKIELTICAVFHSPQNKRYLELNQAFTDRINTKKNYTWIAADNSSDNLGEYLDRENFLVIPGIKMEEVIKKVPKQFIGKKKVASYHHAEAINRSLPYVKTRFILILDADFYIIKSNWASEIIEHMKKNDLGIFGVTWPPYQYLKYRYFPGPHSLFIDLGKVPLSTLDFTPQFLTPAKNWIEPLKPYLPSLVMRFLRDLRARRSIGSSYDTGFPIYQKYYRSEIKRGYATPVFKMPVTKSIFKIILKNLLPDRWQLIPTKDGYFTQKSFRDLGFFDVLKYGGDEFMWQGKPFGFHVRRFKKSTIPLTHDEEITLLKEALNSFQKS